MARKKAPKALAWLRAVREAMVGSDDLPSTGAAIIAVAAIRVMSADADGSRSFVSQQSMAEEINVRRTTIRAIDGWLEGLGLLRQTRWRGHAKEFRLTIPNGPLGNHSDNDPNGLPEGHSSETRMVPVGTIHPNPNGPPNGSPEDHYLLPPTVREEEEGRRDAPPDGGAAPPIIAGIAEQLPAGTYLDRTNPDLIVEADRVAGLGYVSGQVASWFADLPSEVRSGAGIALRRLRKITEPAPPLTAAEFLDLPEWALSDSAVWDHFEEDGGDIAEGRRWFARIVERLRGVEDTRVAGELARVEKVTGARSSDSADAIASDLSWVVPLYGWHRLGEPAQRFRRQAAALGDCIHEEFATNGELYFDDRLMYGAVSFFEEEDVTDAYARLLAAAEITGHVHSLPGGDAPAPVTQQCSVDGCEERQAAAGLCFAHWNESEGR